MSDITAHFHAHRIQELRRAFTPKKLKTLWKSVVKTQMRSFDLVDLHDYYDFTRSIDARTKQICDVVLAGRFRASKPLIYRLEKKHGIKRHMTIASPFDALVLQAIVEAVRIRLEQSQPSRNAYYSRDKHHLKLPHEIKKSPYDLWWQLWPKFQKDIYKFSQAKKYLVVTDLSNYFDSLDLKSLRTAIVHKIKAPEVLIDLMMTIVDDLGWMPDYLPRRQMGLPVIHLESFRFLAHVFLFDADEVLKKRTANHFVRWMDDINFGADTKEVARQTL
ncbi:RNA-directed DNA polymerase [Caenimonas sedimenti]|uniref:RNA-directed DNA polymerase n=1 Tax=Caenimonas sedimenti TaxID=2596921 RepID=A0A562ZRL9_9BURK|nr:RNA-directed DNA polymerase [Caenimonas sedimenti]TWO70804.1 RNA-directed DNA polymerase [Caenimonas sedimenti]